MSRPFLYMAVQRWKPAESLALRWMPQALQDLMQPLIELRVTSRLSKDAKPSQVANELASVAKGIADNCRGYEVFLDGQNLDRLRRNLRCTGRVHPLEFVVKQIRSKRSLFPLLAPAVVPVTGLDRSAEYKRSARGCIQDKRVCIRLTIADLLHPNLNSRLAEFLDELRVEPPDVDLVADLAFFNGTTAVHQIEDAIPRPEIWRSFTVLAGTFPKDLSEFKGVKRHDRVRAEWGFFRGDILNSEVLGPYTIFGDFTIQYPLYPEPPDNDPIPSSSIRYATADSWIVMRGEQPREGGPGREQWPANALMLTLQREFHGPRFCEGSKYIYNAAQNQRLHGNSKEWLAAGINQHMTVTIRELQRLIPSGSASPRRRRGRQA